MSLCGVGFRLWGRIQSCGKIPFFPFILGARFMRILTFVVDTSDPWRCGLNGWTASLAELRRRI